MRLIAKVAITLLAVAVLLVVVPLATARTRYLSSWTYDAYRHAGSVAVSNDGDVYLQNFGSWAPEDEVDRFTRDGKFLGQVWQHSDGDKTPYMPSIGISRSGSLLMAFRTDGDLRSANGAVQELSPTIGASSPLQSFSVPGEMAEAIAEGPSGDLYVSSLNGTGPGHITVYKPDGTYVRSWSLNSKNYESLAITVDQHENIYVGAGVSGPINEIDKFSTDGRLLTSFQPRQASRGMTVGADGNLYVTYDDVPITGIAVYSPNGALLDDIGRKDVPAQLQDSFRPEDLAASSDGYIYSVNGSYSAEKKMRIDVFKLVPEQQRKLVFESAQVCSQRRGQSLQLKLSKRSKMKLATFLINGKPVKTVRDSKNFDYQVVLRKLPKNRYNLTIQLTTKDGYAYSGTQRFRACRSRAT